MLKVQDLNFSFKNRPLFSGLSFSVSAGDLVRIAGPNGSGKSTLIALVTGLISGASGSIEFSGNSDFRSWTSWIAADADVETKIEFVDVKDVLYHRIRPGETLGAIAGR